MIKDVRIKDPYVKSRLEQIRLDSGESSITKTAARLVLERAAQLEVQGSPTPPVVATRTRPPTTRPLTQ